VNGEQARLDPEIEGERVHAEALHPALGHQYVRGLAVKARRVVLALVVVPGEARAVEEPVPAGVHHHAAALGE
jgi:hypothetical protein